MDTDISHHFGGGAYIKEARIRAGRVLVQHRHTYDHLSYLVSGTVEVMVDGVRSTVTGPACLTIEAGKHHGVRSLTDAIWLCVHATEERDAVKVDGLLIEPATPGAMEQIAQELGA